MSCPLCGGYIGDCSCSDTAVETFLLKEMLESKLDKLISLMSEEKKYREAREANDRAKLEFELKRERER